MTTVDIPVERSICIYPAYLNRKRSLCQGRRLSKEKSVDNPTSNEIADVLKATTKLPCVLENKHYSREATREPCSFGRVRILMRNADGSACDDEFQSKKDVMIQAAKMISKLKVRGTAGTSAGGSGGGAGAGAASSSKSSGQTSSASGSAGGGGNPGRNRKKRK